LDRCGYALDCLLNVLRGGPEGTPISLSAAEAQLAFQRGTTRNPWGCWMCWWLSRTVERHHCFRQLRGISTRRSGAVVAGLQLLFVAFVLGAAVYWGVIPALWRNL
jgi:hypothetical protein